MPTTFNFDRSAGDGLLPPGIYRFIIEEAVDANSDKAGDYVNLRIRPIVRGEKWNSLVFEGIYATENTRFKLVQLLNSIGAPTSGSGGKEYFKGKSGWARFHIQNDNNGIPQARVKTFLTEAQAELAIENDAKKAGRNPDMGEEVAAPARRSRPVAEKPKVGELADGDTPF